MAWPHGWQEWRPTRFDGWADVRVSIALTPCKLWITYRAKPAPEPDPEPVEVLHEVSITVESPLLDKEMHFKLTFDAKLENPTIEEIK